MDQRQYARIGTTSRATPVNDMADILYPNGYDRTRNRSRPLVTVQDTADEEEDSDGTKEFESHSPSENVTVTIKIGTGGDGIVTETDKRGMFIREEIKYVPSCVSPREQDQSLSHMRNSMLGVNTASISETEATAPNEIERHRLLDSQSVASDRLHATQNDTDTDNQNVMRNLLLGINEQTNYQNSSTSTGGIDSISGATACIPDDDNDNLQSNHHLVRQVSEHDGRERTRDDTVTQPDTNRNINRQNSLYDEYEQFLAPFSTNVSEEFIQINSLNTTSKNKELETPKKPKVTIVRGDDNDTMHGYLELNSVTREPSYITEDGEDFMEYLKELRGSSAHDSSNTEYDIAQEEHECDFREYNNGTKKQEAGVVNGICVNNEGKGQCEVVGSSEGNITHMVQCSVESEPNATEIDSIVETSPVEQIIQNIVHVDPDVIDLTHSPSGSSDVLNPIVINISDDSDDQFYDVDETSINKGDELKITEVDVSDDEKDNSYQNTSLIGFNFNSLTRKQNRLGENGGIVHDGFDGKEDLAYPGDEVVVEHKAVLKLKSKCRDRCGSARLELSDTEHDKDEDDTKDSEEEEADEDEGVDPSGNDKEDNDSDDDDDEQGARGGNGNGHGRNDSDNENNDNNDHEGDDDNDNDGNYRDGDSDQTDDDSNEDNSGQKHYSPGMRSRSSQSDKTNTETNESEGPHITLIGIENPNTIQNDQEHQGNYAIQNKDNLMLQKNTDFGNTERVFVTCLPCEMDSVMNVNEVGCSCNVNCKECTGSSKTVLCSQNNQVNNYESHITDIEGCNDQVNDDKCIVDDPNTICTDIVSCIQDTSSCTSDLDSFGSLEGATAMSPSLQELYMFMDEAMSPEDKEVFEILDYTECLNNVDCQFQTIDTYEVEEFDSELETSTMASNATISQSDYESDPFLEFLSPPEAFKDKPSEKNIMSLADDKSFDTYTMLTVRSEPEFNSWSSKDLLSSNLFNGNDSSSESCESFPTNFANVDMIVLSDFSSSSNCSRCSCSADYEHEFEGAMEDENWQLVESFTAENSPTHKDEDWQLVESVTAENSPTRKDENWQLVERLTAGDSPTHRDLSKDIEIIIQHTANSNNNAVTILPSYDNCMTPSENAIKDTSTSIRGTSVKSNNDENQCDVFGSRHAHINDQRQIVNENISGTTGIGQTEGQIAEGISHISKQCTYAKPGQTAGTYAHELPVEEIKDVSANECQTLHEDNGSGMGTLHEYTLSDFETTGVKSIPFTLKEKTESVIDEQNEDNAVVILASDKVTAFSFTEEKENVFDEELHFICENDESKRSALPVIENDECIVDKHKDYQPVPDTTDAKPIALSYVKEKEVVGNTLTYTIAVTENAAAEPNERLSAETKEILVDKHINDDTVVTGVTDGSVFMGHIPKTDKHTDIQTESHVIHSNVDNTSEHHVRGVNIVTIHQDSSDHDNTTIAALETSVVEITVCKKQADIDVSKLDTQVEETVINDAFHTESSKEEIHACAATYSDADKDTDEEKDATLEGSTNDSETCDNVLSLSPNGDMVSKNYDHNTTQDNSTDEDVGECNISDWLLKRQEPRLISYYVPFFITDVPKSAIDFKKQLCLKAVCRMRRSMLSGKDLKNKKVQKEQCVYRCEDDNFKYRNIYSTLEDLKRKCEMFQNGDSQNDEEAPGDIVKLGTGFYIFGTGAKMNLPVGPKLKKNDDATNDLFRRSLYFRGVPGIINHAYKMSISTFPKLAIPNDSSSRKILHACNRLATQHFPTRLRHSHDVSDTMTPEGMTVYDDGDENSASTAGLGDMLTAARDLMNSSRFDEAETSFLKLYNEIQEKPEDNGRMLVETLTGLADICIRRSRMCRSNPLEWQWLCMHAIALLQYTVEFCDSELETQLDNEATEWYQEQKQAAELKCRPLEDAFTRALYNCLKHDANSFDPFQSFSLPNTPVSQNKPRNTNLFPLSSTMPQYLLVPGMSYRMTDKGLTKQSADDSDVAVDWLAKFEFYCKDRLQTKDHTCVTEKILKSAKSNAPDEDTESILSENSHGSLDWDNSDLHGIEEVSMDASENGNGSPTNDYSWELELASSDTENDGWDFFLHQRRNCDFQSVVQVCNTEEKCDVSEKEKETPGYSKEMHDIYQQEKLEKRHRKRSEARDIVSPLHAHSISLTLARSFCRLADKLVQEEEYKKAEMVYEKILDIIDAIQDGTAGMLRFSARIMKNLGTVKSKQGKASSGLVLLNKALHTYRDLQDEEANFEIAVALIELGNGYIVGKNHEDSVFDDVIVAICDFFEKDASDSQSTSNSSSVQSHISQMTSSLTSSAEERNVEEAVTCYTEAISLLDCYEADEKQIDMFAKAIMRLGDCYFMQKDYDRALECYEKALGMFRSNNIFGKDSLMENAHVLCMLGVSSFMLHVYPRAASVFETALHMVRCAYGFKRTFLNGMLQSLSGITYYKMKNYHKCVSMCYQGYETYCELFGDIMPRLDKQKFWIVCQTLYVMGNSYNILNLQQKAMKYLTIARSLMKSSKSRERRQFMRVLQILGDCYFAQYDYKTALQFYNEALEYGECESQISFDEVFDPNCASDEMTIHNHLVSKSAEAHLSMKQYQNAVHYLEQAHDLQEVMGEDIKGDLINTYHQLGHMHSAAGDVTKAIESYKDCLEVFREIHNGELGPEMCTTLGNLAAICYVKACIAEDEREEHAMTEAAQTYFHDALTLENNAEVCVKYGNFLYTHCRFTEAILQLRNALHNDNTLHIVYRGLEKVTLPELLQDEVDTHEEICLPSSCLARYLLILSHKAIGEVDEAEINLVCLMEEVWEYDVPLLYSLLGYSLMELMLFEEAAESFQMAAENEEEYHLAMENYCVCLLIILQRTLVNGMENIWEYVRKQQRSIDWHMDGFGFE